MLPVEAQDLMSALLGLGFTLARSLSVIFPALQFGKGVLTLSLYIRIMKLAF